MRNCKNQDSTKCLECENETIFEFTGEKSTEKLENTEYYKYFINPEKTRDYVYVLNESQSTCFLVEKDSKPLSAVQDINCIHRVTDDFRNRLSCKEKCPSLIHKTDPNSNGETKHYVLKEYNGMILNN